jgi:hypothetical protein
MKIIGIGHKARQGKDTVARMIVKELCRQNIYAKQYAFGDALKEYCRVAYGMKEKNSQLLQVVGTDIFRNHVNSAVWINCLDYKLKDENPDVAIITDVRFPNEFMYIAAHEKNAKSCLIRIKRSEIIRGERVQYRARDRNNDHESEIILDNADWDYTISNDGDLVELEKNVNSFLALYLNGF